MDNFEDVFPEGVVEIPNGVDCLKCGEFVENSYVHDGVCESCLEVHHPDWF